MWFDGGARGNPGRAGAGWLIREKSGNIVMCGWVFVGDKETNNTAEYMALIEGLRAALELDAKTALKMAIYGDSKLVVEQVGGGWKCKAPHLQKLQARAQRLVSKCNARLSYIPREGNGDADYLSNVAMDRGGPRALADVVMGPGRDVKDLVPKSSVKRKRAPSIDSDASDDDYASKPREKEADDVKTTRKRSKTSDDARARSDSE